MQKPKKSKLINLFIVILLVAMCAACSRVELYSNLSEEDANEILVLLSENNIATQKKKEVRQNEVFYSIVVAQNDVSKARSLLVQHNLPRRKQLGLTGVYKDKGLIPTPDEQKARFLLALKGEIINSLEKVPDVIDADVVLNLPIVDEFADVETRKLKRPTASVVIKVKPSALVDQTVTEAKIQQFVANSVEGLHPRDVTVIISYLAGKEPTVRPGEVVSLRSGTKEAAKVAVAPPKYTDTLIGLRLDDASKTKLKVYLLIFFVLLLVLSAGLTLAILWTSRMRSKLDELKRVGEHPAVEGEVLSEGPPRLDSAQGEGGYPEEESYGEELYEGDSGGEDEEQR